MSWIFPWSNQHSFISYRKHTQNLILNQSKEQAKQKKMFYDSDGDNFSQAGKDETDISWDTPLIHQTPSGSKDVNIADLKRNHI